MCRWEAALDSPSEVYEWSNWDFGQEPEKVVCTPPFQLHYMHQLTVYRYFCHPMVNGQETHSNHIIMPTAVKDFFKKRTLCCYEYNELPQETEENMFQLVQRGIALTPAEKMRAKSTEWAAFAKQFEEDYSIVVNC